MPKLRTLPLLWLLLLAGLTAAGCVKVGPDFVRPPADVRSGWLEEDADRTRPLPVDDRLWWTAFRDPVLDRLVQTATTQNIPLRVAGARVFEARARLGVAVGEQYPQLQQAVGDAAYVRGSERAPSAPQRSAGADFDYRQLQVGASAAWELDFWGRFRRAVESEDAGFLGSIAAYDSALVSLAADVARVYVLIRTIEERLRIARDNVEIQRESLRIAEARFRGGATSERDVQQALTQLRATEADDPPARCRPAAGRQRPVHPARPAAAQPGRPPRGRRRHPAGAAHGRGRHPGGPAAPPAGHPAGRAPGRGAVRPDRGRQGRPLPRLQPERDLRIPRERRGPLQPDRRRLVEQPHRRRSARPSPGTCSTTARSPTACASRTRCSRS